MKKYTCPICGSILDPTTEEIRCKSCNTLLDKELVLGENPLKKKKLDIVTYATNLEFKTILDLDYDNSELIFAYFKMYASKCLNKEYKEEEFFNGTYKYDVDELDYVILHMLEHNTYYNIDNITKFIEKYAKDNEMYQNMLNNIIHKRDEKIVEKDLREELFPDTRLPFKQKLYNSRKADGRSIIGVGILLLIIFPAIVFIVGKDLKYYLFNIALIIPCLFLTSGICKLILKKDNIFASIGIFLVLYYLITLLYGFSYMEINTNIFFDHLKGIAYTPYELVKALIERTGN